MVGSTGAQRIHPHELYSALSDIEHRKTRVGRPQPHKFMYPKKELVLLCLIHHPKHEVVQTSSALVFAFNPQGIIAKRNSAEAAPRCQPYRRRLFCPPQCCDFLLPAAVKQSSSHDNHPRARATKSKKLCSALQKRRRSACFKTSPAKTSCP